MLDESSIRRYSRHILLREVGGRGQTALLSACVSVPRLDADGRACALWLARSGVGTLALVDDRSPAPAHDPSGLLLPEDEGRPLIEAVSERLRFHAPSIRLDPDAAPTPLVADLSRGGEWGALAMVRQLAARPSAEPKQRVG